MFVGARFVITDVLLARFVERLTEGHPDREHAVRRSKALVFYIFGVYCACCVFLAYDAMLDRSAVSTYRSEAIGVTRSHKVCVGVADALGRGL